MCALQPFGIINVLPNEILRKVLVPSVVGTALMTNGPRALEDAMELHASVCDRWEAIVSADLFKKEVKQAVYAHGTLFLFA